MLRPRHTCGEMGKDQIIPTIKCHKPIGSRQINTDCPFLVTHSRTNMIIIGDSSGFHDSGHGALLIFDFRQIITRPAKGQPWHPPSFYRIRPSNQRSAR